LAIPEQVKIEWDHHVQDVLDGAKVTLKHDINKAKKLKLFHIYEESIAMKKRIEEAQTRIEWSIPYHDIL
jgi:hypothetical protein